METTTFLITPDAFNFQMFLINTVYMAPIFVTFFFLMLSLCNYDFKGLVWLACVLCGMVLVYGVQVILSKSTSRSAPARATIVRSTACTFRSFTC